MSLLSAGGVGSAAAGCCAPVHGGKHHPPRFLREPDFGGAWRTVVTYRRAEFVNYRIERVLAESVAARDLFVPSVLAGNSFYRRIILHAAVSIAERIEIETSPP